MSAPRIFPHLLIVAYLLLTANAFVFTMFRRTLPLPPLLLQWPYGMMAPYQGDTPWNGALFAEGRVANGSWEQISLDQYLPYSLGEKTARQYLHPYMVEGTEVLRSKYRDYALQLLAREREQGKQHDSVRLSFDRWERSPGGFEFLHTPVFTDRQFIVEVP